jgi:hypothetical protein
MTILQNPVVMAVLVIIILGLLLVYVVLRNRRKKREGTGSSGAKPSVKAKAVAKPVLPVDTPPELETVKTVIVQDANREKVEAESPAETGDQFDQLINPDINFIPDVILNPGDETILLILPDKVPVEEVKKFEEFLRGQEVLKIVTTGGSSDEGSNIGIRVLSKVNLTDLLGSSNMAIIKHIHKKGERIVLSCKTL